MTGSRFFPHLEFSVELWIAPTDSNASGTALLVLYRPHYLRQKTFHPAQEKQEIAVALRNPVATLRGPILEPWTPSIGPAIRQVVVTYSDGAEILYVNGVERARQLTQYKHTLSDAFMDFVGHQFKWPLYSAAMCLTGILAALFVARLFPDEPPWRIPLITVSASSAVIEGIRIAILQATLEPVFFLVSVCTTLGSLPVWILLRESRRRFCCQR
jgi:hypothetical protein